MAKFSIITCTFNSEAHIEKTLKNLYSQTFQNFEHIIVDNCSKDKTIEIIKNISFPRRILISEKLLDFLSKLDDFMHLNK